MRAHRDRGSSIRDAGDGPGALAAAEAAREPRHRDPEWFEPAAKARVVLLRQQLRGRHHRDLAPVRDRHHRGERRDHRLPGPHVPLDSRCIGRGRARSARISRTTRCWAAVSLNGSESMKRCTSASPRPNAAACRASSRRRNTRRARWCASSSSNAKRRRAGCSACSGASGSVPAGGRWIARKAWPMATRRWCTAIASGSSSRDVGIALQPVERLVRQAAQQRLPQAHGRGIDRRQAVAGRRRRAVLDQPVLRMHHLNTAGRGTDFAITCDAAGPPAGAAAAGSR